VRVYVGGTFDLFHTGHVNLLRGAHRLAGEDPEVVVALNTDEFVEAYKGRRPVISYSDRAEVLRACRYVDIVIPNVGGADSKPTLMSVRPDLLVVGSDWRDKDYHAQIGASPKWLANRGINLVFLPYTPFISSTSIRTSLDNQ